MVLMSLQHLPKVAVSSVLESIVASGQMKE